jgi:UPF0716 protein FxsA
VALALLALFLIVPVLELWTVVVVADAIGAGWTILALAGLSLLGIVLARREGLAVWRRANAEVAAGRVPTRSLVDGAVGLLGACLLIVPGFLTAAAGLLLLLPPTRALVRPSVIRWMERRAARAGVMNAVFIDTVSSPTSSARRTRSPWGTVIGGTVVDVDLRESGVARADVVDVEVDDPPALPPATED